MTENKEEHDTATQVLNTLMKVLSAIAKVEAAFPAGDYGLDETQNSALNNLNDVSYELRKNIPEYKSMLEHEAKEHEKWQLKQLLDRNIITKDMYSRTLEERGLKDE